MYKSISTYKIIFNQHFNFDFEAIGFDLNDIRFFFYWKISIDEPRVCSKF